MTVEDFPYDTGVKEQFTYPHCWKCVTVNYCWFKNEKGKKPTTFNYTGGIIQELFKKFGMNLTLGIYHPYCHCKEESIAIPQTSDIKLIIPTGKVDYFFKDKINWFYSWGYTDNDKQEFIEIIKTLTKKSFTNGNYEIENHTKYGVKINIFFDLPGKNEKAGRIYKTWTNFMIFPNGCLKNNTIIGGKNN